MSRKCHQADRRLQEAINESSGKFVENVLDEGTNSRSFYSAARKLSGSHSKWDLGNIFQSKDLASICNEVLDYFSNICDPLQNLVRNHPESFVTTVKAIFNAVNNTAKWPRTWKTEYFTIIPKNPNPSSRAECRNISCTSVLSKIFENCLMGQLREELTADPQHFGGTQKCGVKHMLVELWDKCAGRGM